MLINFKTFESKLPNERYEKAVLELYEDFISVFKSEILKYRVVDGALEALFDEVQDEFDKGEEPKIYLTYKENFYPVILEINLLEVNGVVRTSEIKGKAIGLYEAYGNVHSEILSAIDNNEFKFVTSKSYRSIVLDSRIVEKKIHNLTEELDFWKNIK